MGELVGGQHLATCNVVDLARVSNDLEQLVGFLFDGCKLLGAGIRRRDDRRCGFSGLGELCGRLGFFCCIGQRILASSVELIGQLFDAPLRKQRAPVSQGLIDGRAIGDEWRELRTRIRSVCRRDALEQSR